MIPFYSAFDVFCIESVRAPAGL